MRWGAIPYEGCEAPNAMVASMDLSPHSARKISVPTWSAHPHSEHLIRSQGLTADGHLSTAALTSDLLPC